MINLLITGIGGQGIITLGKIIGYAGILDDFDVKVAEIHGLAQRGGTLISHVRIGKKVYSPLIPKGKGDVMLALEQIESLRYLSFLKRNGIIILNKLLLPPPLYHGSLNERMIVDAIGEYSREIKVYPVDAFNRALKIGSSLVTNIVILGVAVRLRILKIKEASIKEAIKELISPKYYEINLKAFNEGLNIAEGLKSS